MSTDPAPASSPVRSGQNRFGIATWVFLRALSVIHLLAFGSLWIQLEGLIGVHGISPAGPFLRSVHEQFGRSAYFEFPTLAWWLGSSDGSLHVLCGAGIALGLLTFFGIAPALSLAGLWVCYLSLCTVGQSFLSFQWDALLLETTLFAIFLAPKSWRPRWRVCEPSWIARGLLIWLLFRLMLLSGVVKLSSGDPTWRNLTALTFHYETQPLPTPLAWYNHHLPTWFHRLACGGMLVIELWVPWFLFAPRRFRHAAALLLAILQGSIALSGNYAFFNLLTITLCFLAFDDEWWRSVFSRLVGRLTRTAPVPTISLTSLRSRLAMTGAAATFAYTAILAIPAFDRSARLPGWFYQLVALSSPFNSLNNYGLFAMMTTTRPELIFEGSDDGREWRAYELPYKPGALDRRLPVVAPHQPRLDWQLWFAALGSPDQNPWVLSVCEHLLRGTPEVLKRFATNPFPEKPPLLIRVVRYDYQFTSPAERERTGLIWRRTPLDFYVEPASLR